MRSQQAKKWQRFEGFGNFLGVSWRPDEETAKALILQIQKGCNRIANQVTREITRKKEGKITNKRMNFKSRKAASIIMPKRVMES